MSGTIDRMAPDGRWYSSTNSAEAEEPIGVIVKEVATLANGGIIWRAFYRGKPLEFHPHGLSFGDMKVFLFPSCAAAQVQVDAARIDEALGVTQRQIDQLNAIAEGPYATVPLPLLPTGPFQKGRNDDRG